LAALEVARLMVFVADKLELFCYERNEKHYNMADKPVCFFTYPNHSCAWLALEAVRLIVFVADKLEQFCCERKKLYHDG
jgi:HD superfamily phosphohydrolase YqeK